MLIKLSGFFVSSFFWGLAFASIRLPPLLGYILSGVILGPSFTKYMSDSLEYMYIMGDFGLLMLMFLAGLELNIEEFTGKNNDWLKPVKTIILQVLLSFVVVLGLWLVPNEIISNYLYVSIILALMIAAIYLTIKLTRINHLITHIILWGVYPLFLVGGFIGINLGWITPNSIFNWQTMVMCACILALNSTAIAIKLLENRDKKHTLVGTTVMGILIGQDLVFVAMLIGLQSLTQSVGIGGLFIKVTMAIGIFYLVKVLAEYKPSIISNTIDYIFDTSRELAALFAITLCFAGAAIGEKVGLSGTYGAFIVGLMLGNVYKHNKYIIKICEPISNILMTLFFMWVGAIFNVQDLFKNWIPITLVSIAIVAFKYFSNFQIIKYVNIKSQDLTRSCIALSSLLLTQLSEFALIMIPIVVSGIPASDNVAQTVCSLARSCTVVSLSIGAVVTVLLKNYLYRVGYIK